MNTYRGIFQSYLSLMILPKFIRGEVFGLATFCKRRLSLVCEVLAAVRPLTLFSSFCLNGSWLWKTELPRRTWAWTSRNSTAPCSPLQPNGVWPNYLASKRGWKTLVRHLLRGHNRSELRSLLMMRSSSTISSPQRPSSPIPNLPVLPRQTVPQSCTRLSTNPSGC